MAGPGNDFFDLDEFSDAGHEDITSGFEDKPSNLPEFNPSSDNYSDAFEESDDLDVPLPPPELKSRISTVRLEGIEDEFLETEASDSELEEARNSLLSARGPLFVNIEEYGTLLEIVKSTKSNFHIFSENHSRLDNMAVTMEQETTKMIKLFESIQRHIIAIDNRIFEKQEE